MRVLLTRLELQGSCSKRGKWLDWDEIGAGVSFDTCIPDFERPVCASGNDRLAVWIELHGHDRPGIGVLDLGEFV